MNIVTPNPQSPFADADSRYRHILPAPAALGAPHPGALLPTACDRLAVVPEEPLRLADDGELPAGICPAWLASLHGEELPADVRPISTCSCGENTDHDGLCAECRHDRHEAWWAARTGPRRAAV
ncbi:hypothetical protein ABZ502_32650 [Streptomyces abikoensis]|uniref:hypothetical protein n=1 Tax=Streptomyces abikoensis TaxID=97398 RepID=UPI0033C2571A